MPKKRSGPSKEPDHHAEPQEIAPSDAATPKGNNSSFLAQQDTDAPPVGSDLCCPPHDGDFPPGSVVYDTGWEDHAGVEIRAVFTAGPPNHSLREWVRAQIFSPVPLSDEETEPDE